MKYYRQQCTADKGSYCRYYRCTWPLNKPVRDPRKIILGNRLIGLVFAIEWMNQIFQSWQQLMIG